MDSWSKLKKTAKLSPQESRPGLSFRQRIEEALAIFKEIAHLEKKEIGAINYALERLRLKQRKLELKNRLDDAAKQQIAAEKAGYEAEYKQYQAQLAELYQKIRRDSLVAKTESGSTLEIPLSKVVRAFPAQCHECV